MPSPTSLAVCDCSLTPGHRCDDIAYLSGEGSAGAMRSVVAARSKARKEEEARQLAEENEDLETRLSQVQSRTDDGDGKST